jgi:hypothetical protein
MNLQRLFLTLSIGLFSPGLLANEISLKDPNAKYADRSCPLKQHLKYKTAFEADCRCGKNRNNNSGLAVCQRPTEVARNMGINVAEGPSFANFYNSHISGGFIDYNNNELIASVYWDQSKEGKGLIVAYNLDDWSRRFVSGDAQDDYGHKIIAKGPPLRLVRDIKPGPDGQWYALSLRQDRKDGGIKIFKIDPKSGERTIVWEGRKGEYGQCPSGRKRVKRETQKYVQYRDQGFAVEEDGSFLVGFNNLKMGGNGIARISADGQKCEFVTLSGKRDDKLKKGRGFDIRGDLMGFYLKDGKIYAHSSGEKTFYEIDAQTGDRKALARRAPKPPAWRHVVWDDKREVFWVSGKMNSVTIAAFDPKKKKYLEVNKSCGKKGHWDWFPLCMNGPLKINSLNYDPMWLNKKTGTLLFGQDSIGIVEFEPETGNSINRSF